MTDMNKPNFSTEPEPEPKKKTNVFGAIWSILTVALVMATLLTLWTPSNLFSNQMLDSMFQAWQTNPTLTYPTPTSSPRPKIGIVAGHWGNDSGAVCLDGLTEQQVNLEIAGRVQQQLINEGYDVDLLEEFDGRLNDYKALALVSIHNDSCDYVNDQATGFKVAAVAASSYPEKADRLKYCLADRYIKETRLGFHDSVTIDMSDYHSFREINPNTTAAIIETGFLNLDRQVLTEHTDQVAKGVADGILCYIRNEPVAPFEPTPSP